MLFGFVEFKILLEFILQDKHPFILQSLHEKWQQ